MCKIFSLNGCFVSTQWSNTSPSCKVYRLDSYHGVCICLYTIIGKVFTVGSSCSVNPFFVYNISACFDSPFSSVGFLLSYINNLLVYLSLSPSSSVCTNKHTLFHNYVKDRFHAGVFTCISFLKICCPDCLCITYDFSVYYTFAIYYIFYEDATLQMGMSECFLFHFFFRSFYFWHLFRFSAFCHRFWCMHTV